MISPTDPIAATSVGKRLGLPSRLLTMLEGEGLVNDATALVLLRSAVAALAATVSLWQVLGDFVVAVVVAVIAGLLVGWLGVRARAMLDDPVATTAVSFVIPFLAYLPAEEFHGSGVLAVVVAGLVSGHLSPRHLGAQDRLVDATNWRTVAFLLESAIFLLMGLSLSGLIDDVRGEQLSAAQAFGIGLLAALVVMVIRAVFIVPLVASLRLDQRRAAEAKPRLEQISARIADTGLPPESKRLRMMLQPARQGLGHRRIPAHRNRRRPRRRGTGLVGDAWRDHRRGGANPARRDTDALGARADRLRRRHHHVAGAGAEPADSDPRRPGARR